MEDLTDDELLARVRTKYERDTDDALNYLNQVTAGHEQVTEAARLVIFGFTKGALKFSGCGDFVGGERYFKSGKETAAAYGLSDEYQEGFRHTARELGRDYLRVIRKSLLEPRKARTLLSEARTFATENKVGGDITIELDSLEETLEDAVA